MMEGCLGLNQASSGCSESRRPRQANRTVDPHEEWRAFSSAVGPVLASQAEMSLGSVRTGWLVGTRYEEG